MPLIEAHHLPTATVLTHVHGSAQDCHGGTRVVAQDLPDGSKALVVRCRPPRHQPGMGLMPPQRPAEYIFL